MIAVLSQTDPRVLLVGLVVGTLVGLSGVGGGSLVTPLLVLALGIPPAIAVGTDLLYSVPTKILGAILHHKQGTVDGRLVRLLALGGIPGALLGLVALHVLNAQFGLAGVNALIRHLLGVMLFIAAAAIVLKPLLLRRTTGTAGSAAGASVSARWPVVALGALVGFVVSLTSIGSGSLTLPLLFLLLPQVDLRRLVGTDVAFASLLVPVAALGHLQMGQVNIDLAMNLVLGSLPGVVLGSRLCAIVPVAWFRSTIAGVLVFAGSKLV